MHVATPLFACLVTAWVMGRCACVQLPEPPTSFLPGGIPKVIHQVFLSGPEELKKEEDSPTSKFRRDWRRSCQVHNPGWRYILWDQAMAEALLKTKYPWFLKKFQSTSVIVVKGDAIRPFILHAYGGVYLDMDTECMGSLEDSLSGHSLVLQSEAVLKVNNAQMASVPEHPFWIMLQQRLVAYKRWSGDLDINDILKASGPTAVSQLIRDLMPRRVVPCDPMTMQKYLNLTGRTPLAGTAVPDTPWLAQLAAPVMPLPTVRIYSLKEWFQACEWNRPDCRLMLAQCAPVVRAIVMAKWREARVSLNTNPAVRPMLPSDNGRVQSGTAPRHALPATRGYKALLEHVPAMSTRETQIAPMPRIRKNFLDFLRVHPSQCVKTFGSLVGAHQFSGSWIPAQDLMVAIFGNKTRPPDAMSEARRMMNASAEGMISFFGSASLFVEVNLTRLSPSQHVMSPSMTEDGKLSLPARKDRGRGMHPCELLSIVQFQHPSNGTACCEQRAQPNGAQDLAQWAVRHNCSLTVFTDVTADDPRLAGVQLNSNIQVHQKQLCLQQPCTGDSGTTLAQMLKSWQSDHMGARLTMLHMSCPGDCSWTAVEQLHVNDSPVLLLMRPRAILIDTGAMAPNANWPGLVHSYQHLYQELGYVGQYYHRVTLNKEGDDTQGKCEACPGGQGMRLPALRLGFTQLASGQEPIRQWQ